MLIAIGGMSGSGKTTLAAALASGDSNALHLDADRIRKQIFGVPDTQELPSEAYGRDVTRKMIDEMNGQTKKALSQGKTVIVSSILASDRARQDHVRMAEEAGAQFVGLWLETDVSTLFNRVSTRDRSNPSDATEDWVRGQAQRYSPPTDWLKIDASQTPENVKAQAQQMIAMMKTLQTPATTLPRPPRMKR